jgi:hypothetical protein
VALPYGTNRNGLAPVISLSPGATISPLSGAGQNFNNTVNYTVTAQDGTTKKTYAVTATLGKNTAADILTFKLAGKDCTISGTTITVTVPYGTPITSLAPTITLSPGANVNPAATTAQDFSSQKTYTVTAEDGTTKKDYTVKVTVAKNTAKDIKSFTLAGKTGTISGTNITVTVPYGTTANSLKPAITLSPEAKVSPASGAAQKFTHNSAVDYTVTAQDGTTKTYKVTVTETLEGAISIQRLELNRLGDKTYFYPFNPSTTGVAFNLDSAYKPIYVGSMSIYYSLPAGVTGSPASGSVVVRSSTTDAVPPNRHTIPITLTKSGYAFFVYTITVSFREAEEGS